MSNSWDELISEISGIKPKAYLILGSGWVREEWKSLCFGAGKGLIQQSVQNLSGFTQSLVPESKGRLLDQGARIDLMRQSLKDENLKAALPTLFIHQYRPKFFDSLDGALQRGRMFFAHADEAKVLEARLVERLGFEARREEFFLLNRFWETLLVARDFFDEARLLEVASFKIRNSEPELSISKQGVSKVYRAEHFPSSPRIDFFWQMLSEKIEISLIPSEKLRRGSLPYRLERKMAHSLEDAAQFLLDEIIMSGNLNTDAVVIEDLPEVRRTVSRIAKERGIPLLDSRDPTFLATSEEMKTALLPLEIVARNFSNAWILPWLNTLPSKLGECFRSHVGHKRKKIIEMGNVTGLENYQNIPDVYEALQKLRERFKTRMTVVALEQAILESVREAKLPIWVAKTLERVFKDWKRSLDLLGSEARKIPLRILLDELNKKIRSATPLQEPLRNANGLKLYRVDQAPSLVLTSLPKVRIHFFGLSARFFEPSDLGSEWFSVRDIDILSAEFGIPGRKVWSDQARVSFCSWASLSTEHSVIWEYQYDEGGTEVESLSLLFQTLDSVQASEPASLPVHPRILPALSAKIAAPKPFTPIEMTRTEFPMSFLNSLGNCAFTAYAQHLLKLYDERDPDFDLSGDSFGNLVHSAVEALVASKLQLTPLLAFQEAWKKTAKPAWIRSERLFKAIRSKTISILESFLESEIAYRKRSQIETLSQELPIQLKRSGFLFHGRLDRIDQHADGIIVIDYKTGSSLPGGSLTLEKGKGLQLPAYALALKDQDDQDDQEVIGAHYVQLLPKKTMRNTGLIFSKWNKGKKSDAVEFPITTVTSRSSSLIEKPPETVWMQLDQKIENLILQAKQGNFTARPADPNDCTRCRYQVLCGKLRESIEVEI